MPAPGPWPHRLPSADFLRTVLPSYGNRGIDPITRHRALARIPRVNPDPMLPNYGNTGFRADSLQGRLTAGW